MREPVHQVTTSLDEQLGLSPSVVIDQQSSWSSIEVINGTSSPVKAQSVRLCIR